MDAYSKIMSFSLCFCMQRFKKNFLESHVFHYPLYVLIFINPCHFQLKIINYVNISGLTIL